MSYEVFTLAMRILQRAKYHLRPQAGTGKAITLLNNVEYQLIGDYVDYVQNGGN
jgi:hypothetical protein